MLTELPSECEHQIAKAKVTKNFVVHHFHVKLLSTLVLNGGSANECIKMTFQMEQMNEIGIKLTIHTKWRNATPIHGQIKFPTSEFSHAESNGISKRFAVKPCNKHYTTRCKTSQTNRNKNEFYVMKIKCKKKLSVTFFLLIVSIIWLCILNWINLRRQKNSCQNNWSENGGTIRENLLLIGECL